MREELEVDAGPLWQKGEWLALGLESASRERTKKEDSGYPTAFATQHWWHVRIQVKSASVRQFAEASHTQASTQKVSFSTRSHAPPSRFTESCSSSYDWDKPIPRVSPKPKGKLKDCWKC